MAGFPRVHRRLNLTSVSNTCEAAPRCMFVLGSNGLDKINYQKCIIDIF